MLDYTRTLASTWTVSVEMIAQQDPDALALLKYLAYYSNQDIWYELLIATGQERVPYPAWLTRVTATRLCFDRAMQKLVNHSLVDAIPGSFRLHPCLHDWLLATFNEPPNQQLLTCAAISVHRHLRYQICAVSVFRNTAANGRMMTHLERLRLPNFRARWVEMAHEENCTYIACIFPSICMRPNSRKMDEAAEFLDLMLKERQRLNFENFDTAALAYELGKNMNLAHRFQEAEQPLRQALRSFDQALGTDNAFSMQVLRRLAEVYVDAGNVALANQMIDSAISSVNVWLDHTLDLPMTVKECYVNCLVLRTGLMKYPREYARSCIHNMVRLAKATTNDDSHIIYVRLGIMLKASDDDTNARRAFRRGFVKINNDVPRLLNIMCCGCGQLLSIETGYHVCGACLNQDICRSCLAGYKPRLEARGVCKCHRFFDATPQTVTRRSQTDPWLQRLLNMYDPDKQSVSPGC